MKSLQERPTLVVTLRKGLTLRIPRYPTLQPLPNPKTDEFCPIEYRRTVIEKFRRHSCQHPSIPIDDEAGTYLTADEIYEGAVIDMYQYCYTNGLVQTWAYLWNCWYEPSKWPLWARAPCPLIPTIRTTMITESFWRHFKHGTLASFSRPRLDLVVYLIVTQVLSATKLKLSYVSNERRKGRPKPLRKWQETLKAQWTDYGLPDELRTMKKELQLLLSKPAAKSAKQKAKHDQLLVWLREDSERNAGTYHTSLEQWTCSCPSYLISRFLLCKHLARAANTHLKTTRHGLRFFYNLRRRTSPPFYLIPGIHPPSKEHLNGLDSDDECEIVIIEEDGDEAEVVTPSMEEKRFDDEGQSSSVGCDFEITLRRLDGAGNVSHTATIFT